MSIGETTKLRWFDKGAEALSRQFPDLAELVDEPFYLCPQCFDDGDQLRGFFRSAVQAKYLTAEHVPPGALGGKELVLTCADCNHRSGSRAEAAARKRENLLEILGGESSAPTRAHLRGGGHIIAATFRNRPDFYELMIPPERRAANDPIAVQGFEDYLRGESFVEKGIGISFHGEAHRKHPARVAWLRAAYLAMFAVAGYGYIFAPGLALVRRQIRNPADEHIPTFLATLPGKHPKSTRRIVRISKPEWHRAWAVQMGRYVAFLPLGGDTGLYDRLHEGSETSDGRLDIVANASVPWRGEPSFGVAR